MPWRLIISRLAKSKGFLDPVNLMYRLSQFAQPSEVMAPIELLRAGAVLHARGLINSQAIQHNLDWIWPFWVQQQFNPKSKSFIPRAFSLTHINLTHRNWTAVGLPGFDQLPIADPRGLITPFFDGWSIDGWIITGNGKNVIPSKSRSVSQTLNLDNTMSICTSARLGNLRIDSTAQVAHESGKCLCRIHYLACADTEGWLVISVRPFNPEGISFIHNICLIEDKCGLKINHQHNIYFNCRPDLIAFSNYNSGDVYNHLFAESDTKKIKCDVGMASAAAIFELKPNIMRAIVTDIPYEPENKHLFKLQNITGWDCALADSCKLEIPDEKFKFLYDCAVRTVILHSPSDIYAGPYTYKRFWFRDAVFIIYSLLCCGFTDRAGQLLDKFPARQKHSGYFLSQEGEWDSNGQVLWIMEKYCRISGSKPPQNWYSPIKKAADWIIKKRIPNHKDNIYSGLFPAGFSAEHLGPSDHYFWDNFWGIAGLAAASYLMGLYGDYNLQTQYSREWAGFLKSVESSIDTVSQRIGYPVIPASANRRLDSGAIGSLCAGYPLMLWGANDARILNTAQHLLNEYVIEGGFFHDITHSGINAYLTLHIAQILLRAGDFRFFELMQGIAGLASPTGQWPEAIHPATKGGCMGDGQHAWAAAEWILMMRNCFVREENDGSLVLCSGIPQNWHIKKSTLSFGPAPTLKGTIFVRVQSDTSRIKIQWEGKWIEEPEIEVRLPGYPAIKPGKGICEIEITV